jgi:hypothetical protein
VIGNSCGKFAQQKPSLKLLYETIGHQTKKKMLLNKEEKKHKAVIGIRCFVF